LIILIVLSGFLLALLAPLVHRVARGLTGWVLALLPAGIAVWLARQASDVAAGEAMETAYQWVPTFGIWFSFRLDGLALLFALLISGIGALVLIYAGGYMAGHALLGRFYGFLLFFMGSMLGVALADNVITLFVFWELTSVSSYLLIGFDHEREASRRAALQALLVTGGGGLALLAGLVLLGLAGGSMEMSHLNLQGEAIRQHALYLPILLLVLIGAMTKSAQFPFHFWLPSAMEAPTPVSAYLHSATMVKAGVFLLARLHPALGGTEAWTLMLSAVGATTMLVGAYLAMQHTDLKRMLAYSTISALGILVLLIGLGTPGAMQAAVVFLLAHALYKGSLFMVAGAVDHETGTRQADRLGGLWRAMPITALAAVLASLSLAGFGPFLSFIGKEMFLEAVWETKTWLVLVPAAVLAGGLLAAVAGVVGLKVFFGRGEPTPKSPHEAPPSLWLGPILLGFAGLATGLFPTVVAARIIAPAAAAMHTPGDTTAAELKLALWHGVNAALLLSVASLTLGLALFLAWRQFRQANQRLQFVFDRGPAQWYEWTLTGMFGVAAAQTRLLQNGYLRYYLLAVLATFIGLVGYPLAGHFAATFERHGPEVRPYEGALALLIVLAIIATVRAKTRLTAIASLGVVGYGVALVFILFGAPDLAMTQIMIETLTVILFALVLYKLPRFSIHSSASARLRDAVVALSAGAVVVMLMLAALDVPDHQPISGFYSENSYPAAHGRNIVNVILVDFRGFDTLGEITVLAVAAVGIYGLLKLRPSVRKGLHADPDSAERFAPAAAVDAADLGLRPGPRA
jgi:multicomponent Na+:H+ antiporter subunit A